MKKIFGFLCAICFMLYASVVSADVNYGMYITPKVSYSFYTGDYIEHSSLNGATKSGTSSFGGGLALGYDFYEFYDIPVRVEAEYMMRTDAKFNVNDNTVKASAPKTLFMNGYLDYQNDTMVTPYLTAGAGVSFIDTQTKFAWNVGTGARVNITENVDVDFSVKYVNFGRYDLHDYTATVSSIDTSLGLAYTF